MPENFLWKLLPESFKENIRNWVRQTANMSSSQMLAKLYEPLQLKHEDQILFFDAKEFERDRTEAIVEGVPVPGWVLRKGYGKTPEEFVQTARTTAALLRTVMKERGIHWGKGEAMLDWGCATGRVLQEFREEAVQCEFWGTDIDGSAIAWAKEKFSPPFHFVTCTVYPHLPFEDRQFTFIYGGSLFTHIRYLEDCWLVELKRILKPGGVLMLTVQNEDTVQWFRDNYIGTKRVPRDFDIKRLTAHDQVYFTGDDWAAELVFMKTDWIRKSWGRYFNVVDVKPQAEGFQTAVVLSKKE